MYWIVCFIAFILGAISMFTLIFIGYTIKSEEPVNKVKFFVAEPIFVLPLYVSSVTFTVALVTFGRTLCAGVYPL